MNATSRPKCYGTMFTDIVNLAEDQIAFGKIFSVLLQRAGGLLRCNRDVTVDQAEWQVCRECPTFESYFKFSMAQLAL